MRRSTSARSVLVVTAASAALGSVFGVATTADAASTTPVASQVQNFCTQVRQSQSSIASLTGTMAAKNKRIGIEWGKIETVSPTTIKSQVSLIKAAYVKAATQPDTTAKTTVSGITAAGQKVTAFVSANCGNAGSERGPGDGDRGPGQMDPARRAAAEACFKKEGVTVPADGTRPNFDDPKFQAAAQKCGFGGPGGGPGGRRGISDAVRKCVTDKGFTLPTRPAGGGAGGAGAQPAGSGQRGGMQLDDKTRAALEACRTANP